MEAMFLLLVPQVTVCLSSTIPFSKVMIASNLTVPSS